MIAKIAIVFVALILLPDAFLWYRYFRKLRWWKQVLWFLPSLLLIVATVLTAWGRDFVPDNMRWLNTYLFLLGVIALPKLIVALCSLCGKKGWMVGVALVPVVWYIIIYGSFWGNEELEVKRIELSFKDLPASFDGYRLVQFSDIHVGSISPKLLQSVVDSINAEKADVVVFTGDIQNKQPKEILPYKELLSSIKAEDGVISVRGNHDFANYIDLPSDLKSINEELTIGYQQDMDWRVLVNGRREIRRGQDSIIIAGLDNDGEGVFPQKGNINRTLWGLSRRCFIVMLEHDPSSWRRKILPHSHAQLTLSGHTHAMQFELFGWSPLSAFKKEVAGLYQIGTRYLYVSKGVGGVIPFRFGASPEIVVITLRKQP